MSSCLGLGVVRRHDLQRMREFCGSDVNTLTLNCGDGCLSFSFSVPVSLSIYIYIHTHTHIYIYTHTYTHTHTHTHTYMYTFSSVEGHGNPLQYSCLENPINRVPGGLQSTGPQRVGHD